jgi:uncharacterized membrane protein
MTAHAALFAAVIRLQRLYGLGDLDRNERKVFDAIVAGQSQGNPARMGDLTRSQTMGRSTVYRHVHSLLVRNLVAEQGAGRRRVLVPADRALLLAAALSRLFGAHQ